jgi:hypothetical protein
MERGCIDPSILILGSRWRCVVSFTPRPLFPQRKNPGNHWRGGCVSSRVGLEAVKRRESSCVCRKLSSDPLVIWLLASRYNDWSIAALSLATIRSLLKCCWLWIDISYIPLSWHTDVQEHVRQIYDIHIRTCTFLMYTCIFWDIR